MKTRKDLQKQLRIVATLAVILIRITSTSAQYDSLQYARIENPTYFGYEIGVGVETQSLASSIPQLDRLTLPMHGANVGVKVANSMGALRATGGLYYSGENAPHTVSMIKGGISGNIYLLRLKKVTYRTFEPYALVSVSYHRATFLGTYLPTDVKNKSVAEDPELGKVDWCAASFGGGVEFQLENDANRFIHFFAEARYGVSFLTNGSNIDFSDTHIKEPVTITLGMSFGKIK